MTKKYPLNTYSAYINKYGFCYLETVAPSTIRDLLSLNMRRYGYFSRISNCYNILLYHREVPFPPQCPWNQQEPR